MRILEDELQARSHGGEVAAALRAGDRPAEQADRAAGRLVEPDQDAAQWSTCPTRTRPPGPASRPDAMAKETLCSTCVRDGSRCGTPCRRRAPRREARRHQRRCPARGSRRAAHAMVRRRSPRSSGTAARQIGLDMRAARAEAAAGDRLVGIGNAAGDRVETPVAAVERRDRGHQALGIGMHRRAEQHLDRRLLDDRGRHTSRSPARRTRRSRRDRARSASPPCRARSRSSRSSSRICAWMVTSSAVVGSSAISSRGRQAMRDGDHHALAHAAREAVRILVDPPARIGDPHQVEQLDGRARGRRRATCPDAGAASRRSGRRSSARD